MTNKPISPALWPLAHLGAETEPAQPSAPTRIGLQEIAVSGIWMRRIGDFVELLAENPENHEWMEIAREHFDGPFSHIVEPNGVQSKFLNLPGVNHD